MHEWALAESVIETVKESVRNRGRGRVVSVTLLFGELQAIDEEIFKSGLRYQLESSQSGGGEEYEEPVLISPDVFSVETEKASFLCNRCGNEWSFDSHPDLGDEEREAIHFMPEAAHAYMRCPACGSPDFSVERGRGVLVKSILFEEEE